MVRSMSGVQLKDRIRAKRLMLMLSFNKTMDQLSAAYNVCWYGHVLWREDGHVLRMASEFEVEGQRKKRWLKRTLQM